jgi:hypothetical protein
MINNNNINNNDISRRDNIAHAICAEAWMTRTQLLLCPQNSHWKLHGRGGGWATTCDGQVCGSPHRKTVFDNIDNGNAGNNGYNNNSRDHNIIDISIRICNENTNQSHTIMNIQNHSK